MVYQFKYIDGVNYTWNGMLNAQGLKVVYVVSDRCDGRRLTVISQGMDIDTSGYPSEPDFYVIDYESNFNLLTPIMVNAGITDMPAILVYNNQQLQWVHSGSSPDIENMIQQNETLIPFSDILAYDSSQDKLVILNGKQFNKKVLPTHLTTNWDVLIGVNNGFARCVACGYLGASSTSGSGIGIKDSNGNYIGIADVTAAAASHYRIESLNNNALGTQAGSFTFTATTGNKTTTGSVSWSANTPIANILSQIESLGDYSSRVITSDNKAIGFALGGYGANTLVLSNIVGCKLVDCTFLATFDQSRTIKSGDSYNSSLPTIKNGSTDFHKSYRGTGSASLFNTWLSNNGMTGLTGTNYACYDMLGGNRNYRCVINLAGCKYWGGDSDSFVDDGAGGTPTNNIGLMKKTVFNNNVNSSATGAALRMYNFYMDLRVGNTNPDLRSKLIDRFNLSETSDLWDWYLACHAMNPDSNSGIVNSVRNKGKYETHVLGCIFTVDYNYKYYPAYPPEYNTCQYEMTTPIWNKIHEVRPLQPVWDIQIYGTAEPWDLTWMYADKKIGEINSRQNNILSDIPSQQHNNLANNVYTGSFAQSSAYYSWSFNGDTRVLVGNARYYSGFRPRPVADYLIN